MLPVHRHFRCLLIASCLALAARSTLAETPAVPRIRGDWWSITGNPDVGDYTTDRQQPVDFAIWQAADGMWQLWSCIRHTKAGDHTRLFYRWEGKSLTSTNWTPKGIAMEADPSLGETSGGLQAPYVFREGDTYFMFYGDWERICLAKSSDGKTFTRLKNELGQPNLFTGPWTSSRDPMVFIENGIYYCYYTAHTARDKTVRINNQVVSQPYHCAVFCRTSADMRNWSEPTVVAAGGSPEDQDSWHGGDAECPFVLKRNGYYYLFRNQRYGTENLNTQYASRDPHNFGVGHDGFLINTLPVAAPEIITYEGQEYIAALKPTLDGIRMAKLGWSK